MDRHRSEIVIGPLRLSIWAAVGFADPRLKRLERYYVQTRLQRPLWDNVIAAADSFLTEYGRIRARGHPACSEITPPMAQ